MADEYPAVPRVRLGVTLLLGIAAVSFGSIFVTYAHRAGAASAVVAAWRLVFASSLLVPYAWATRREELLAVTRTERALSGVAGLFLALHFAAWIASLRSTTVASSVVLVSLSPVFVGLGAWIVLRERPPAAVVAGLGLALFGSVAIGWGDFAGGNAPLLGDALALTGAVGMAGYLLVGRKVRARHALLPYIAHVYGAAALALLGLVAVVGEPMLGLAPMAYVWMLALGLIPQLLGHSTLNWALRHVSATYVSLVCLAEPIGAGVLAFALLGEAPTVTTMLGGAVTLTGIWIASRAEAARSAPRAGPGPGVAP